MEILAKQQFENVIVVEDLEAIMMNVQEVVDNADGISDS